MSEHPISVSSVKMLSFNLSKNPCILRRFWLIVALLLAVAAINTTIRRIDHFSYRYKCIDYVVFYQWGVEYETGQPVWVQLMKGKALPPVSRYRSNYTPVFVEAFAPLTRLGAKVSHELWEYLQVGALLIALVLIARMAEPRLDWPAVVAFVALALTFKSVRNLLWFGQCSAFLLLLLTLSWTSSRREHPYRAGFWLALATLLKIYPGVLGGYFLLRRKWREVVTSAALFFAGVLVTGPNDWIKFWIDGTPKTFERMAWPQMAADFSSIMPNIYRLVAHFRQTPATPSWLAITAITAILDLLVLAALAFMTLRSSEGEDGLVFGMWLAGAVLLSPLAWRHELVMLFPAYLFTCVAALSVFRKRVSFATAFVVLLTAICLISEIRGESFRLNPGVVIPALLFTASAVMVDIQVRLRNEHSISNAAEADIHDTARSVLAR